MYAPWSLATQENHQETKFHSSSSSGAISSVSLFYVQHLLSDIERQLLLHLHTDHHSYPPDGSFGHQIHIFLQVPQYSHMFQSVLTQVPDTRRKYLIGSTGVI